MLDINLIRPGGESNGQDDDHDGRLIAFRELTSRLGRDVADEVTRLGRHQTAAAGSPCWPADELSDLLGLVELERKRCRP
jgi:hypothetical protein